MIRVAVVDDHPVARRGLESMLGEAADMEVSASVGSPDQLTDGMAWPDVVLLDLYHEDDTPCLPAISRIRSHSKVLVVSVSERPSDVLGAVRAGAMGYVTKLAEAEMLVAAVRTVARGGFALSAQLADILQAGLASDVRTGAASHGSDDDDCQPQLSPREEQALELIARGFTHAQAARRMGVSKTTVDTYVERIRIKLQVGNKAELTRAAINRAAQAQAATSTIGSGPPGTAR
jgi:DNA-binding NarL/FixJ family response regulator